MNRARFELDPRLSTGCTDHETDLAVSQTGLGNGRYSIRLDPNGDIAGILDRKLNKELLSAPVKRVSQPAT